MELTPNQSDPTKLEVVWEEEDLRVLSSAYTEKLGIQMEGLGSTEGEDSLDDISDLDIVLAKAYAHKKEHLSGPDELPREWVEDIIVTLRSFAEESKREAGTAIRRNAAPRYANPYLVDRLDLGKKALVLAQQLENPENTTIISELEASYEMPAHGEIGGAALELPAGSAETDEAA